MIQYDKNDCQCFYIIYPIDSFAIIHNLSLLKSKNYFYFHQLIKFSKIKYKMLLFPLFNLPNSGTRYRQFGHLKCLGIELEEIEIQGFGDLPKLVSINVMLLENLADGARVARQLLRKPDVAAPLPFHFGFYSLSYVWEFVHPDCPLPSFARKKQPKRKRGNFLHHLPLWISGLPR